MGTGFYPLIFSLTSLAEWMAIFKCFPTFILDDTFCDLMCLVTLLSGVLEATFCIETSGFIQQVLTWKILEKHGLL